MATLDSTTLLKYIDILPDELQDKILHDLTSKLYVIMSDVGGYVELTFNKDNIPYLKKQMELTNTNTEIDVNELDVHLTPFSAYLIISYWLYSKENQGSGEYIGTYRCLKHAKYRAFEEAAIFNIERLKDYPGEYDESLIGPLRNNEGKGYTRSTVDYTYDGGYNTRVFSVVKVDDIIKFDKEIELKRSPPVSKTSSNSTLLNKLRNLFNIGSQNCPEGVN